MDNLAKSLETYSRFIFKSKNGRKYVLISPLPRTQHGIENVPATGLRRHISVIAEIICLQGLALHSLD